MGNYNFALKNLLNWIYITLFFSLQVRHMSDGRKGFFARIVENVKQEMTVNPEMKVCHREF